MPYKKSEITKELVYKRPSNSWRRRATAAPPSATSAAAPTSPSAPSTATSTHKSDVIREIYLSGDKLFLETVAPEMEAGPVPSSSISSSLLRPTQHRDRPRPRQGPVQPGQRMVLPDAAHAERFRAHHPRGPGLRQLRAAWEPASSSTSSSTCSAASATTGASATPASTSRPACTPSCPPAHRDRQERLSGSFQRNGKAAARAAHRPGAAAFFSCSRPAYT
jgi:hypothetical protein